MVLRLRPQPLASSSRKKPAFHGNDSALHYSDVDSSDDEEEQERRRKKTEKRKQSRESAGRTHTSPPGSQKRAESSQPISPRAAQSQQIPTRTTAPGSSGSTYPSMQTSSSMTNVTRGMDFMSLNPPSPLHTTPPSSSLADLMRQSSQQQLNLAGYQQQLQQPLAQYQSYGSNPQLPQQQPTAYGSNPQLLQQQPTAFGSNPQLLQQQQIPSLPPRAQPVSPPISLSAQPMQPVQSPPTSGALKQQPMLYAVPAQQQTASGTTQQGTYYMDPTAYAHYVQQLQMQQLQLLQQQQLLQQHQLLNQQGSSGSFGTAPLAEKTV